MFLICFNIKTPMMSERTKRPPTRASTAPTSVQTAPSVAHLEELLEDMIKRAKRFPSAAVVLDIDGTILHFKRGGISCGVLALIARKAHQAGLPVFVITARVRRGNARQATIKDLEDCGMEPGTYELFLMPERFLVDQNWSRFKGNVRKTIREKGYTVLINAGDNWGDLLLVPPYGTPQSRQYWRDHIQNLRKDRTYFFVKESCLHIKLPQEK